MDARATLKSQRPSLMGEFERRMRTRVNDGISGKSADKADSSKVDVDKLTLVDTSAMDESVVTGNITRAVENLCNDELQSLNRGIGYLRAKPDLETNQNPLAPAAIVDSFAEALNSLKGEERIKFAILKEINQASLADINTIYANLNKHLTGLRVVPAGGRGTVINRGSPADRARAAAVQAAGLPHPAHAEPASAEVDVMSLF